MFASVKCSKTAKTIRSGIRNLIILKSTGSGFENYPKDEFTTLPETADRILATSFSATWTFKDQPAHYGRANEAILARLRKLDPHVLERAAVEHPAHQQLPANLGARAVVGDVRVVDVPGSGDAIEQAGLGWVARNDARSRRNELLEYVMSACGARNCATRQQRCAQRPRSSRQQEAAIQSHCSALVSSFLDEG